MKAGKGKWQLVAALVFTGIVAAQGVQAAPSVKLYGQVDRGLLWATDGDKGKLYFVDNKNSSTRFGFNAKAALEGGMTAGAIFEAEFQSNSSSDVNQKTEKVDATLKERHMDFYLSTDFGKLSLGQGNTASNETSEIDLSGTSVIGYSDVELIGGGIIFYDNTKKSIVAHAATPAVPATATTPAVPAKDISYNPKVGDVYNNLDGLSRDDRVRYDTPVFGGFQLSTSAAAQKAFDVALRYAADFGGMKISAGAAYADLGDQNKLVKNQVNGSLSLLTPFGLSVTGAAGQQKLDDPARKEDPMFWYAKLGYTAKLFFAGSTSVAVDYAAHNDIKKDNDKATSIGAYLVQRLDNYGTELFIGYRTFALDRTGTNFADVGGLMTGARIKF
ncbi:MAG: porin [Candidatus Methylomirabilia bacterium]